MEHPAPEEQATFLSAAASLSTMVAEDGFRFLTYKGQRKTEITYFLN